MEEAAEMVAGLTWRWLQLASPSPPLIQGESVGVTQPAPPLSTVKRMKMNSGNTRNCRTFALCVQVGNAQPFTVAEVGKGLSKGDI